MADSKDVQSVQIGSAHDIMAGRYANIIQVTAQAEEFILDFLSTRGETPAYHLARLFVTPRHAKRLRDLLTRQVAQYEKDFGTITALTKKTTKKRARKTRTTKQGRKRKRK